ncbi:hypothetical protein [Hydrogenimonas sp.]
MNNLTRLAALSIVALLLVWAGAAWFIERKTTSLQHQLQERRSLMGRYETLKNRWSQKAQRKALKKFETMLRLYGIKPTVKKLRDKKLYTFTLQKKNADKVLGKLLESPLALASFEVEKLSDTQLQVRVGVAL